ncbi:helix-turn-helix domain-containing protein [Enterococcus sp. AZ102]|uniref:helix-turn-helix domain-containing protein n=1 Tax=Enterococcus sp. AZ102 TaxID=2774865 RepID=UPI003F2819C0
MSVQECLGDKIKQIRKSKKMMQKMLAQGVCSQSVLSRIENNLEIPNVSVLQQLCVRLAITMDQLMYTNFSQILEVQQFFVTLNKLLIHKKYHEMDQMLDETEILDRLYLDTDLQLYFYHLGIVEYFVKNRPETAIQGLRHGLSYTYSENKKDHFSSIEVQIIGFIGRIYADTNRFLQAEKRLERSVKLAVELPIEQSTFEVTKVFYHYARFLCAQMQYEKSIAVAIQGVKWSLDRLSYYYIEDLLHVASQAHEKIGNIDKSQWMRKTADSIKTLTNYENGVDLS